MREEWRPVVGFEGCYEISNKGRVRSVPRVVLKSNGRQHSVRGKILAQKFNRHYWCAKLSLGGILYTRTVHLLVCEAFHGPRPEGAVVRHLNGDYVDNRPENLRWGTWAENTADMISHGNAYWAERDRCKYEHEYTPENTRWQLGRNGRKFRVCRECERIKSIPKNAKRDEAARLNRPVFSCDACGKSFQSSQVRARWCSKPCKDASRRVGFIPFSRKEAA